MKATSFRLTRQNDSEDSDSVSSPGGNFELLEGKRLLPPQH